MESALLEFDNEYITTASGAKGDGNEGLNDITNTVHSQRDVRSVSQKASSQKKKGPGPKTDCVRIRCSTSSARDCANKRRNETESTEESSEFDAEDEMIWWSWENRLEGFGL